VLALDVDCTVRPMSATVHKILFSMFCLDRCASIISRSLWFSSEVWKGEWAEDCTYVDDRLQHPSWLMRSRGGEVRLLFVGDLSGQIRTVAIDLAQSDLENEIVVPDYIWLDRNYSPRFSEASAASDLTILKRPL
jgi:hypothetical protein